MPRTRLAHFLVILVVTIATRLPFLEHPIQGDDYYYLASAMYGQTDPLHPGHAHYVFQGKDVDMRGHPHPPLNAWILTGILALTGGLNEVTLHLFYLIFSLIAAMSMWALAVRYSPHAGWTTLLMLMSPAFLVSGNSLESDLPFFAFFLCGVTAFFYRKVWLAVPMLALAGLAAYQSVVIVPILWLYLWMKHRDWRLGWVVACTPAIVLVAWQVYERVTGGEFPVAVAAGYFSEYGLQRLTAKVRNAIALSGHLFFIVGPFLTGAVIGRMVTQKRYYDRTNVFLFGWLVIFFVSALVLFFAGSARYLLPMLPAAAILTSRVLEGKQRWLAVGAVLQGLVGMGLAFANYSHWKGYQDFVNRHRGEFGNRRVWVNGEWGLRYYAEALGGLPMRLGQAVQPGDLVLSSQLAYPIPYSTGGGTLAPFAKEEITPELPFRLVGLTANSAWSTASMGLLPFDLSTAPVDVVRADLVIEKQPTLSFVRMGAPQAESHIVSGIYQLESGLFRWMGEQGSVFLKSNGEVAPLEVKLFIPDTAPARTVILEVDGKEVDRETFRGTGLKDMKTPPVKWPKGRALVTVRVDQTFVSAGDTRRLGIILQELGVPGRALAMFLASEHTAWAAAFLRERELLLGALGDAVVAVEHVGSTSVPGVPAKPILDILIGVASFEAAVVCVAPMRGLAYEYRGEYGIARRHYFVKGSPRTHHVHVHEVGGEAWWAMLGFRDALQAQAELAREYAEAKVRLAAGGDRGAYQSAKDGVVEGMLRRLGLLRYSKKDIICHELDG